MSAWPEAVYIIRQIQNALNLNQRVLKLQNRLYVFAPIAEGQTFQPDLEDEYDFSNDSIWFIEKTDDASKVYAMSVYSEEQGWSNAIYLSPNTSQIDFTPTSATGAFQNIDNVQDALNALINSVSHISMDDATYTSKGIVRIDHNTLTVNGGLLSVPIANPSTNNFGLVKLYDETGGNNNGTMTQAAISAAIGQSAASSENVLIPVSSWSENATATISGSNYSYYNTEDITLSDSYGQHPTIAVAPTSPYDVPTKVEIEEFNKINFITVNGNEITLLAKIKPTVDFTINVKV